MLPSKSCIAVMGVVTLSKAFKKYFTKREFSPFSASYTGSSPPAVITHRDFSWFFCSSNSLWLDFKPSSNRNRFSANKPEKHESITNKICLASIAPNSSKIVLFEIQVYFFTGSASIGNQYPLFVF